MNDDRRARLLHIATQILELVEPILDIREEEVNDCAYENEEMFPTEVTDLIEYLGDAVELMSAAAKDIISAVEGTMPSRNNK